MIHTEHPQSLFNTATYIFIYVNAQSDSEVILGDSAIIEKAAL